MTTTCTNVGIARQTKPRVSPIAWIALALSTSRTRRALKALDADRLSDIGLSREDADREATRPVWDVPAHWLR